MAFQSSLNGKDFQPSYGPSSMMQDAKWLSLQGRGITCFPEEVLKLTHLETIDLGSNKISIISEQLTNLKHLKELSLYENQLSFIPEEVMRLTGLEKLSVFGNQIRQLPESISRLVKLTELSLGRNMLISLPECISLLIKLKRLYAWENQLSNLPSGLGSLGKLAELECCKNQISELPTCISSLSSLRKLMINVNKISHINLIVQYLHRLEYLDVGENKIMRLPEDIGSMSSLRFLRISLNQVEALPETFCRLSMLEELHIEDNKIQCLPFSIGSLSNLQTLHMYGNQFERIPESFTKLTKLTEVCLEGHDHKIMAKMCPRGITDLPCWENHSKPLPWMSMSVSDSLSKLELYDIVSPWPQQLADLIEVNFRELNPIGAGGFANAYVVNLRAGRFALKIPKVGAEPGTELYDELTAEARLMVTLDHPNIIHLYAYGGHMGQVIYVMEYAEEGSLQDLIKKKGPIQDESFYKISNEILQGLIYLHTRQPPVTHRDLKPENVLMRNGAAKLADFGLSQARETVSRTTGFAGTLHYSPPEAFDSRMCGTAGDMYTFGLIMWAMWTAQTPYLGMGIGEIGMKKFAGVLPDIPEQCPRYLAELMKSCWAYEHSKRPSAQEVSAMLCKVTQNPGSPISSGQQSVKRMANSELISFLEDKRVLPEFVGVIRDLGVTGSDFLGLSETDLQAHPFNLSSFQRTVITRLVKEFN